MLVSEAGYRDTWILDRLGLIGCQEVQGGPGRGTGSNIKQFKNHSLTISDLTDSVFFCLTFAWPSLTCPSDPGEPNAPETIPHFFASSIVG